VKGGPLTLNAFENYKPHCSFNTDGTINQETLDALNDVVNLEASKPPNKDDKADGDVSDDIVKMIEVERIHHQEQAIEEAEMQKVSRATFMLSHLSYCILQ
jgi:hypothetical protein